MADTTFINGTVIEPAWLNDANDAIYKAQSGTAGTTDRTLIDKITEIVSVKDFGATGGGVSDDLSAINTSIVSAAGAAGKALFFPSGTYNVSDDISLRSNLVLIFHPNAKVVLTGSTSKGHVVGGHYSGATAQAIDNIVIINPRIDCGSVAGENGFGVAYVSNLYIYNPIVENTLHSTITLGGRAFQFEGGTLLENVHVFNPVIKNCSIGLNTQADAGGGTKIARNIHYYNVVMNDVDVPFNVDAQYANPENGILEYMSSFVHGAALYNCGKLTWSGATALGGGIVCGDRSGGISIDGLRVVNSSAYGQIGALTRGMMYNVRLRNVEFNAAAYALYNSDYVGFGSHSTSANYSTIYTENVISTGDLDYVLAGSADNWGASKLHAEITGASLTGVCDTISGAVTTAYLCLVNGDTKLSPGWQTFKDYYDSGNTVTSYDNARTGFFRLQHSKSVADETATQLFKILAPANTRLAISYTVSVMYPTSANDGAVRIEDGVIVGLVDGASNATSAVQAGTTQVALDTVASQTVTMSVAYSAGEFIISASQNNEANDATCLVMITATIHYSVGATATAPTVTRL